MVRFFAIRPEFAHFFGVNWKLQVVPAVFQIDAAGGPTFHVMGCRRIVNGWLGLIAICDNHCLVSNSARRASISPGEAMGCLFWLTLKSMGFELMCQGLSGWRVNIPWEFLDYRFLLGPHRATDFPKRAKQPGLPLVLTSCAFEFWRNNHRPSLRQM